MRSGAQYLVELKLMHVEAGYVSAAWLKRTFDLLQEGVRAAERPSCTCSGGKGDHMGLGNPGGQR
jgi:hypothetical protein